MVGEIVDAGGPVQIVVPRRPQPTDVFYVLTRADPGVFTGRQPFDAYREGATISLGGGIIGKVTYLANWTGSQATSTVAGGNDMAIFNVVVPELGSATLLLVALALFALLRAKQRVAHPVG